MGEFLEVEWSCLAGGEPQAAFHASFLRESTNPPQPTEEGKFSAPRMWWVTPGDARDGSQCTWPSSSRAYKFSVRSPTREDDLPWLFASERQAQLTRQAVN